MKDDYRSELDRNGNALPDKQYNQTVTDETVSPWKWPAADPDPSSQSNGKDYKRHLSNKSTASTKMNWKSIWVATIIMFLVAVQFSIYFASLWPYMSKIDPTVSQTFYGITLAAFSGAQMISSPLFGYWSNRLKQARMPIFVGVVLSVSGSIVYLFAETPKTNQRWVIFGSRILCGFGGGISGVIRGYLATASTVEHRTRVVAIGTAALSLGVTAGPALQAIVSPIGYPGYTWGPLHFNLFSAPAYVSVVAGIILLTLLMVFFQESSVGVDHKREVDPFHYVPKSDMKAAIVCILCYFTMFFCFTNNETVESPYTMAVFSWTKEQASSYNSIILSCSAAISCVVYVLFAIFANKINERVSLIAGFLLVAAYFIISFPWPIYTGQLSFKNETQGLNSTDTDEPVGCDDYMDWCNYTPRLPLVAYLIAYPLISLGFPCCNVAISTLFSKILGPRRQGVMQSLMIMAGSSARLFGPILITWLFSGYGSMVAWTMTVAVITFSICVALTFYDRLIPLVMRPHMNAGDKLQYDGGTLYRF